jgi:molecular chaperone GrpE
MKKLHNKQEKKTMIDEANDLAAVRELGPEMPELPGNDTERRLADLEAERDALRDRLLRAAAEFENFRRRNAEERVQWIRNATERLSLEFCDVLDNFDRALATPEGQGFVEGVKMIRQQVESLLKKEGVERIEARDTVFNPMVHEAVAVIPSPAEQNRVVEIVQNGYLMNGKVIRAAKVVVSSGVVPSTPIKEQEE